MTEEKKSRLRGVSRETMAELSKAPNTTKGPRKEAHCDAEHPMTMRVRGESGWLMAGIVANTHSFRIIAIYAPNDPTEPVSFVLSIGVLVD